MLSRIFVPLIFFPVLNSLIYADGFWAENQKNSFRTGISEISGNISDPETLWSYYRGGYVKPESAAMDEGMVYFSINGRIRALDSELNQIWESGNFGAGRIFRVTDLDSDGEKEIVAGGLSGLYIISTEAGEILSSIATGSPEFAKFADLDGDGSDEIIVRDKWGSGMLRAYGFKNSSIQPVLLWQISENIEKYGMELVAGDLNNDGIKELITDRMNGGRISVFNAYDGVLLLDRSRVLQGDYAYGLNQIINVDSDPQNEFIFSGTASSETDNGSYSITVYDYVNDSVQWQYEYGWNTMSKGLRIVPGSVADFNSDGVTDIAVSVFNNTDEGGSDMDGVNAPGIWTTLIYRADNGVLQAELDNSYLECLADLDGNGVDELILKSAPDTSKKLRTYSTVTAYSFFEGNFKKLWAKDKIELVKKTPSETENTGMIFITDIPVTVKNGSADGIVAVEDINRDGIADRIFSMTGSGADPVVSDVANLNSGKNLGFIASTDSEIYFTGSDGYIHIFDRGSVLKNEKSVETGSYNGNSIFIHSASKGMILSTVSTGSMVLLDPEYASLIVPPLTEWIQINQFAQPVFAFDSDGDGRHEFISLSTDTDGYTEIYLHSSDGGLIWGWTAGKINTNPANFISGDFDGDGFNDVAFTLTSEEEGAMLYSLKGTDGSEIGRHDPKTDIHSYFNSSMNLLGDIDNDGIDDIYLAHSFVSEIIRGGDLSRILKFTAYSWPDNTVSFDFSNDGVIDIFCNQRTGVSKDLFSISGGTYWSIDISGTDNSLYQYSAPYSGIADIDNNGSYDIAVGGKYGDISAYSGVSGDVLWRKCLKDGTVSDISADVVPTDLLCDGTYLSNIVTGDINGDGVEDFVTGDRNGNLYVLKSTDGSLVWTLKFEAALGNPVLADLNGDGLIEILTGADNGFLYAVGSTVDVPEPSFVKDVETSGGEISGTEDIDEIVTGNSYGGLWQAVSGAVKYHVKLSREDETVVVDSYVAGANQVVFDVPELISGDTVYLSVKTVNAGGYESDWVISDGATFVTDETVPDSDQDAVSDSDITDNDILSDTDGTEYPDDLTDDYTMDDDLIMNDEEELPDSTTPDEISENDHTDEETATDAETEDIEIDVRSKNSGCGCSVI